MRKSQEARAEYYTSGAWTRADPPDEGFEDERGEEEESGSDSQGGVDGAALAASKMDAPAAREMSPSQRAGGSSGGGVVGGARVSFAPVLGAPAASPPRAVTALSRTDAGCELEAALAAAVAANTRVREVRTTAAHAFATFAKIERRLSATVPRP